MKISFAGGACGFSQKVFVHLYLLFTQCAYLHVDLLEHRLHYFTIAPFEGYIVQRFAYPWGY